MSSAESPPPNPPQGERTAAAWPVDPAAWRLCQRQWASPPSGSIKETRALPWLHEEVARRMADRLGVIRRTPMQVLDWGARAGQSRSVLQAAYPEARWTAVEDELFEPVAALGTLSEQGASAPSLATRLARALGLRPAQGPASQGSARILKAEEVPAGCAQLLWSNMALHRQADPRQTLGRWLQALEVDGFLMFSTFGPDTLRELRTVWAGQGWGPAHQPYTDMHDWGDALVACGFADPVMDQETIRLSWPDVPSCLAELRSLGRNAHPQRHPGLRTPRWRGRLQEALQGLAGPDGRLSLSFEIIYGHAFRPAPRVPLAPTAAVPLEEMRRLVQSARTKG